MKKSILLAVKSVFRSFKSNIISILGMSLAFLVSMLITIYISDQLSVDKSQSSYNNIYRMEKDTWALMAGGVIPWVEDQFPEVVSHTRIGGTYWESIVDYRDKYYTINDVLFIDGEPFNIFDFDFVYGEAKSALEAPNSVILSDKIAKRIFGSENPMGNIINYNGEYPLVVSAVIKERSDLHLQFDILIKFGMLADISYQGTVEFMNRLNGSQNFMGYYHLNTEDPDQLIKKVNSKLIEIGAYDADNDPPDYLFRPFSDIYFNNAAISEHGVKHGNLQTVISLIFVALFVLLIATINYINVTTAQGITRAKEVGLRKLVGSGRTGPILQFIVESAIISILSMFVAILLILIFYKGFQSTLGIILPPINALSIGIYIAATLILIIVSLAGGIYPALYLSSLKPGSLFKTNLKGAGKGLFVRRILLLTQFTIAIFLTIQSITIFNQYQFMKNKDLGMDKDHILLFELPDYLSDRSDAIRNALLEHKKITGVSYALQPLGNIRNTNTLTSPINETNIPFKMQLTDPEYFEVLDLKLSGGRAFIRDREADRNNAWIINETGARAMGYENPTDIIGLRWKPWGGDREIEFIGVAKDYHFNSVNKAIQPSIIRWADGFKKVQLRFSGGNTQDIINHIENVWLQFEDKRPLNFSFLDETFDKNYNTQQKLGSLISIFTIIAVIIACFGIYGISSFMARQKSKSISLRRVMGADTSSLVKQFISEYTWIITLAAFIAIPFAFIYIKNWLSNFPYKADIPVWVFVLAFALNMIIALATVAYHAFKTAKLNPAEVLRHE